MSMRNRPEIQDRLDGCRDELDAHLHPAAGKNPTQAAFLQGWVYALSWALERDDPYNRSDEIRELLEEE